MKIENQIKQKEFTSVHHKAHINILYTSNWLKDRSQRIIKKFEITQQQYNVLRILKGRAGKSCSAQEIKEVMIDKRPDLTRLIDRLILKSLVTRQECEENRRKLDIMITEKGISLIKKIEPLFKKMITDETVITDAEAIELSRILDKMSNPKK